VDLKPMKGKTNFQAGRKAKDPQESERPAGWRALDYGFFGLSGLGRLSFRGGGRLSLRFSMTTTGSLGGGRLSWSFRCANAQTDATTSIANTTICRTNLIIFANPPHASCANRREKETRREERLQDKCHKDPGAAAALLREKSNKKRPNSHGFEFCRTLSCKRLNASL
jgi:hypothetical protein